jgi:hypothetical protein
MPADGNFAPAEEIPEAEKALYESAIAQNKLAVEQ